MGEGFKEKLSGFNFKKYLPIIGIAVAIIAVIAILVSIFGGGPKKVVKKYIKAINKQDVSKLAECVDFKGKEAWDYTYNKDFDEDDYEEFQDAYGDVDEDDAKDAKKSFKERYKDNFDDVEEDYKSYKFKIEEFKDVEKIGKKLYKVRAKISVEAKAKDDDGEDIDSSDTATFIVYKNKLIYSEI